MPLRMRWGSGRGKPTPAKLAASRDWKIREIIKDLKESDWWFTEPARIERRSFLGSWANFETWAKDNSDLVEWDEAVQNGFEHEIVEEFMEALAEEIKAQMRDHVWVGTGDDGDGDVFAGQYEEGDPDELRRKFHPKE